MAGTARQVHLGRKLKELRKAAGYSLKDAATHLDRSRATVGHWETGNYRASQQDLIALLDLYGADDDMTGQLLQLRKEANQRGWWQSYKLPEKLAPFVGFESEASEKFHFEVGVIPGLLQTEAYAQAINSAGRLALPEENVNTWVEARLKRQERLEADGGLTLHAVIAEEALKRVVGSSKTMADQVAHLEDMAALPGVNLRVLPYQSGAHVAMVGPIVVLRFPDGSQDDIAYSETPLGGNIVDDLRDVAELSRLFGTLYAQALPESETLKLLASIEQEHHRAEGVAQ